MIFDDSFYTGDYYKNLKHGNGEQKWQKVNESYKGNFNNDNIDGVGVYTWPDGKIY